jgi:hypothetical protein
MSKVDIEEVAKVIRETREAALNHLKPTDPYRAGFLGASSRITFEIASKLPPDIATQFITMVGI